MNCSKRENNFLSEERERGCKEGAREGRKGGNTIMEETAGDLLAFITGGPFCN